MSFDAQKYDGVSGIWRIALTFLPWESEAQHRGTIMACDPASIPQEAAPAEALEERDEDEDAPFVLTVPGRGSVPLGQ